MSTVPGFLRALVDDAAIFPPGSLPLPDAVEAHRRHLSSPYAALVGPFVISDARLPELPALVGDEPLTVAVVVTGGAGAIEPAVRWAARSGTLRIAAVETALRDEDDLARNASRVVTALDQVRIELGGDLDETSVYVEPPRHEGSPGHGWLSALDVIASAGLRLKFRTGGVDERAVPSAAELAASIDAALDRELPFKCTAGLHHALRSGGQHGFLNVLAATAAAWEGASTGAVASVLEAGEPKIHTDGLESARRWFTSFGSCSIAEPVAELTGLGLIEP